jgi:type IV pilus assembly protein PilB
MASTATGTERLGDLLIAEGLITREQLASALADQKATGHRLGYVLVKLGVIQELEVTKIIGRQYRMPAVDLSRFEVDPKILKMIPAEFAQKNIVLPLKREGRTLTVAMADPTNTGILDDLKFITRYDLFPVIAGEYTLRSLIEKYYETQDQQLDTLLKDMEGLGDDVEVVKDVEDETATQAQIDDAPVVKLINGLLTEAVRRGASDIHIEPFEHELKIKYRIDGLLVEKSPSSKRLHAAIISRIKIMANMNIAERFVPQDGHIDFAGKRGKIDLRVSTVPTVHGEAVALRIMDKSAALINLEDLGMDPQMLAGFERCLHKTYGIVLVTGPTGCGKTTTLYAALKKIYSPTVKMITIEDPVEYQLDGVNQMPVNNKRGLTFATGLRHILRHDPDIVMVGEIRDRETADIAIRAALTGHLVFSTLHTNDAAGAVTRLIDMGVEPFLLSSSLEGILAQRLVRRICPHCKEPCEPDKSLLKGLNGSVDIKPNAKFYRGAGCNYCGQTGMLGRTGIFELLRITGPLRDVIATRPTTDQILRIAPPDHVDMVHDGVLKVLAGLTTPEEIMRVAKTIGDDD